VVGWTSFNCAEGGDSQSNICSLLDYKVFTTFSFNSSPVADAGPDQFIFESETTSLDGSGSYDPDGSIVAYNWSCTGGTLSSSTIANPTYTPPSISGDSIFTCTLEVTDDDGATDSDWMDIAVFDDNPPTASLVATPEQGDTSTVFSLDVSGSTDDVAIIQVRFSSDDNQNGTREGTWTNWYDWNSSSGDWDSSAKVVDWIFATSGPKEVWAEVDDGASTDTAYDTVSVNSSPVAEDDMASTDEDTPVTIDVLANDMDPDGDPLFISSVTTPLNGDAVIDAGNTVTYTPNAGFNGTDTFMYIVNDGNEGTATGIVTVFVSPVNTPPSATITGLNNNAQNYCGSPSPVVNFQWQFNDPDIGDYQTAYQVQIDDDASFVSPIAFDSGKTYGDNNSPSYGSGLDYLSNYYWRVQVWDSQDVPSGWILPSSGLESFETHNCPPACDFEWVPGDPVYGEEVRFIDNSSICASGDLTRWEWDFGSGVEIINADLFEDVNANGLIDIGDENDDDEPDVDPIVKFIDVSKNVYSVKLIVTGNDISCYVIKDIDIILMLPDWWEVSPNK